MYTQTVAGLTVAQLLLKYLKLEGIPMLFGIPGGAVKTVLSELALQQQNFTYVVCRQETGAAYIAEGYARVSGLPGVVLVTSGPGATNALTGVMNGHVDRHPLILITGEVPEQLWGKGFLQEGIDGDVDVNAIYQAATAFSEIVTHPNNFQTTFTSALRTALSLPNQTVHISLPDDIAGMQPYVMSTATPPAPIYQCQFPVSTSVYRSVPASRDPQGTQAALDALLQASYPLIFLGNGCRQSLQNPQCLASFTAFVEKFQIPVMTTPDAKGIFPESHPLSLRCYGMGASTWSLSYADGPSHDALLIVASRLDECSAVGEYVLSQYLWSSSLVPANGGPVIQVDLDQHSLGKVFPISQGVVAEAGLFLSDLSSLGMSSTVDPALSQKIAQRFETLAELKINLSAIDDPAQYNSEASPSTPAAVMKAINEGLPSGSHIFVDSGNVVGWTMNYLAVDPPSTINIALGMGAMGWSVGAVIGAKLAAPDAVCLSITGDGAFLMNGSELATAAAHNAAAIYVVLNDNDLSMVSQGMKVLFPQNTSDFRQLYRLGNPDLKKYSEALGADAFDVHSPAEMREALETALRQAQINRKPQVIVAHIDKTPLPPYYSRKTQPTYL
jgi:acetolactate synthase-1/2/3 large subunit